MSHALLLLFAQPPPSASFRIPDHAADSIFVLLLRKYVFAVEEGSHETPETISRRAKSAVRCEPRHLSTASCASCPMLAAPLHARSGRLAEESRVRGGERRSEGTAMNGEVLEGILGGSVVFELRICESFMCVVAGGSSVCAYMLPDAETSGGFWNVSVQRSHKRAAL